MSEWQKVKLDDCLELITYGFTNPMPDTAEGPWKITAKDINGKIDFTTARHTSQEAFDNDLTDKSKPKEGDILLTKDGTLGRLAIVGKEKICINQSVALLRLKDGTINREFLYYLLLSPEYQGKMLADAGGSTIKHIYITRVNQLMIPCPPMATQHRIATILSRYDSLIENYQKQIKLLEEAAQRLYKEWFIDLHFPGHENTNIIDGVPEGWEKKKVGEIAEFKRGKTITKKDIVEGSVPVVAGGLEPAYYCNKHNTTGRVITISGSGANAGFTRLYYEKVWASDCSFADTNTTKWLHFVYCFLQASKSAIDNMQKGAAQPHVYAKDINALDIMVPDAELLIRFEDYASKYFNKVQSLQSQLRLLTEARDRLLPKLMSGEIEV